MGFGKSFISGLGSSAASAGIGFVGNALSQAFGLSWSPKKAIYRDWEIQQKHHGSTKQISTSSSSSISTI